MAVANAWATGHSAVPTPQLRPFSSASPETGPFSKKKYSIDFSSNVLVTRSKNSKLACHCASNIESGNHGNSGSNSSSYCSSASPSSADWDWNRWTRHFSEIEHAESYASVLKFQLDEVIESEDFQEAATLKKAIMETTSKDSIAEIMSQLKCAVEEERYQDASRLCQSTGSGLVGWWVGYSKDSDDPFGRLIRITPGMGRFIGRTYSPRQLVTSSPGSPLFEIFVVKDAKNGTHKMQVVFLKRTKGNSANSSTSSDKSTKSSASEIVDTPVVDDKVEESEAEKRKVKSIDMEGADEGIKSVMNFLKEKIPELKFKVMKVNVTEDITEDTVRHLIEEDNENTTSEDSEDEAGDIDGNQLDRVTAQGDNDTLGDEKNLDMKLYIGGVLHNKEDDHTKDEFVRVPANIKDMERDSFVFHIPKRDQDNGAEENTASKVKVVAAITAQSVSELMPPDVAKVFMGSDKVSSKISKDVREMVKLAVSHAQKQNRLSEYTDFSRITTPQGALDPFDGLYVGAFGPYGTEVVQLRRKYGSWTVNSDEKSSDMEFFEYVEAVKLTGDLNVPAGQVTFRAKIGRGNRLANRGMYPDELGVVASYRGQGRIAEFGFQNPKWVEGELLQLNGKGLGPYVKGADLGFLYVVPEQSFLVLFNRLRLPE
ncbi:protein EXECUTER 1, chloroplastic [Dorcoceras hygrometricum]|uniref:Protein EXECUTER 1, chloroplastic n=1 Tax=Dorcoceras hygrometricum TaxID=472368 RepID=A0A2Z7CIZ4_9LAMI|nr:protein EXECUTER 1, chloroplastic [Dorcoceras hygrometricum]